MRVAAPTDTSVRREPAGQNDGSAPLLFFFERACYTEALFSPAIGFQIHASATSEVYEFHSGTVGAHPALLLVLEPREDAVRSAVMHLRQAAPRGIASFALGGTAHPLDCRLNDGQLVLVSDHVNLLGDSPLASTSSIGSGYRFPDMSHAYDNRLLDSLEAEAAALNQPCVRGVYLACHETADESDPFIRAAIESGASVRGTGIAPLAVLGAALRVPVAAAVVLHENARAETSQLRLPEERKALFARVLVRGVLSSLAGKRSGVEMGVPVVLKKAVKASQKKVARAPR